MACLQESLLRSQAVDTARARLHLGGELPILYRLARLLPISFRIL
jgi:hypothetical protein